LVKERLFRAHAFFNTPRGQAIVFLAFASAWLLIATIVPDHWGKENPIASTA